MLLIVILFYLHSTVVLLKDLHKISETGSVWHLHSTVVLLKGLLHTNDLILYYAFTFYCSSIKG